MSELPPPASPLDYNNPMVPRAPEMDLMARQWGMFGHLSALSGFLIPFGNFVGPLVVWQMKKDEIPFASDQAKEALNFNITILIMLAVSAALICVVVGVFLLPLVGIYALVMTILASIAANKGEWYRYPFTLRLVK